MRKLSVFLGLVLAATTFAARWSFNGLKLDYASITTAASLTSITKSAKQILEFTGTMTQSMTLPAANTLAKGYWYEACNSSTGNVTIKDNSGTDLAVLSTYECGTFTAKDISTAAGQWLVKRSMYSQNASSGRFLQSDGSKFNPSSYTFPSTIESAGKLLQSNGTNFVGTNWTMPTTISQSAMFYSTSANEVKQMVFAAQGDILCWDGTNLQKLTLGTNNQLLTVDTSLTGCKLKWASSAGGGALNSYYLLDSPNGYGSTNTAIRRFSNVTKSNGTDITLTQSAANGDSFTINTSGEYCVTYTDRLSSASASVTVSFNQSNLTTFTTTASEEVCTNDSSGAGVYASCAHCVYMPASTIIRANCSNACDATGSRAIFGITRVQ